VVGAASLVWLRQAMASGRLGDGQAGDLPV